MYASIGMQREAYFISSQIYSMNKRSFSILVMGALFLFHQQLWAQQKKPATMYALVGSTIKNNRNSRVAIRHMKIANGFFRQSKASYIPDLLQASGINTLEDANNSFSGGTAQLLVTHDYIARHLSPLPQSGRTSIVCELTSTVTHEYCYLLTLHEERELARRNVIDADSTLRTLLELNKRTPVSDEALGQIAMQVVTATKLVPEIEKHITLQTHGLSVLTGLASSDIPKDIPCEEGWL